MYGTNRFPYAYGAKVLMTIEYNAVSFEPNIYPPSVHREDAEKSKQQEDYPKSNHSEDDSSNDGVRSVWLGHTALTSN
jgi:hypothetical protein